MNIDKPLEWFVVADSRRARLLRYRHTPAGSGNVEACDTLENDWPGHEHHRPSPLGDKTGHAYASTHHEEEEDRRRFAHRIADWVEQVAPKHRIERLALFAPPHLLGVFRERRWAPGGPAVDLREGELAQMNEAQLRSHSLIQQLFGAAVSHRG